MRPKLRDDTSFFFGSRAPATTPANPADGSRPMTYAHGCRQQCLYSPDCAIVRPYHSPAAGRALTSRRCIGRGQVHVRYFRYWLASPWHAVEIDRLGANIPERPTMTTDWRSRHLWPRVDLRRQGLCNVTSGGDRDGADEAEHAASRRAIGETSQQGRPAE